MKDDTATRAQDTREHIVIVGGGFAGLTLANRLDKRLYRVTLVDKNNFHSFPPLFYQVAASELDPASISFPFRRELSKRRGRGVEYHMGEVKTIDFENRTLRTSCETIAFDRLVIAAGTTNNFFGSPTLQRRVYTLKSTSEALRLRNEVLDRLERASVSRDAEARRRMLTFVVVGGGPAGVEIAGALGGMKRYILKKEYPEIDPSEVRIILLEGSDRVLRAMSEPSSRAALADLASLLVEVRLDVLMQSYGDDGPWTLRLSDGSTMQSETVIWTAGITGVPFDTPGLPAEAFGPGGRFVTDTQCRLAGAERAYALGDISYTATPAWPRGYPQLAQVAIQQARYLADHLNRDADGDHWPEFSYRDKGTMATIGRNRAVADLKHFHLSGFFAWLAWMVVHLISLLGMRNRLVVLINWMWAYFTLSTSLRLLIHATRWPERPRWRDP